MEDFKKRREYSSLEVDDDDTYAKDMESITTHDEKV